MAEGRSFGGRLVDGDEEGRYAQGAVVSPLLANVYLHYVFDLWVEALRHTKGRNMKHAELLTDNSKRGTD